MNAKQLSAVKSIMASVALVLQSFNIPHNPVAVRETLMAVCGAIVVVWLLGQSKISQEIETVVSKFLPFIGPLLNSKSKNTDIVP